MIIFSSVANPHDRILLPNPKFGDTHSIHFKRINRTTRGNDLILRNPDPADWTPTLLHKYDFEYLCPSDSINFYGFMQRNLGQPVSVTGLYKTDNWIVLFIRPDNEFAQVGRENRITSVDMQIVSIGT